MARFRNFFIRAGIVFAGLFVIFLVFHTGLNIYASRKIKDEISKIKDKGEPLSLQDFIQKPIPEEENAATIYNKVFSLLDTSREELDKAYSVKSYTDISQWTDEEKKDIPIILEKHDEIFDFLHTAALKDKCNFNLDYSMGFNLPLPHLAKLRECARLLLVKTTLDMENGDADKAIERIIDGFAVARASRNDYTLISGLVRIACDTIMVWGLEDLIEGRDIPYISYQKLYNLLTKERQAKIIPFVDERCFGIDVFNAMLYKRTKGLDVIWGECVGDDFISKIRNLYIKSYLHRPFLKLDYAWYLKTLNRYVELAKRPYWETIDIFSKKGLSDNKKNLQGVAWALSGGFDPEEEAMSLKGIPKICFFTRMLVPALLRTLKQEARFDAQLGGAEIAMALRMYKIKYGNYPLSLNELIPEIVTELPKDPFTGKDFIYKKKGEGFIVYSLGDNCRDDGGNWGKPSKWSGDFDILFEMAK